MLLRFVEQLFWFQNVYTFKPIGKHKTTEVKRHDNSE